MCPSCIIEVTRHFFNVLTAERRPLVINVTVENSFHKNLRVWVFFSLLIAPDAISPLGLKEGDTTETELSSMYDFSFG